MCFCFWIIAVLSDGIQTYFVFARYFYSLCNPIIFVFHTTRKVAWKMFKKIYRNELNTCLGYLSTDSQVSCFSSVEVHDCFIVY